jgi:VCBS repeat-containing protein
MKKMKWNSLILFIVFTFNACKKENKDIPPIVTPPIPPPTIINHPPVANAGDDQTITLSLCYSITATAELDGSLSSDPDTNIISYSWKNISTTGSYLYNASQMKATAEKLIPGDYVFELTVKDKGDLSSRDTVTITVKGSPEVHYLDLFLQSSFIFQDNVEDCGWDDWDCQLFDIITLNGNGSFIPIGEFNWYISQFTDTASSNYTISENYMGINVQGFNGASIIGFCSVNLKELIMKGGGAFNGTFTVNHGSAFKCDNNIYNTLEPLSVTGTLDVATKKINIRIQGKVYF